MKATVISKPDMQRLLRGLRETGYQVDKLTHGYEVLDKTGLTVLKSMAGRGGYLVRYDESVLTKTA